MQSYLKIKIKSLATEAQIIRFEERKVKTRRAWHRLHQKDDIAFESEFNGLREHRRNEVRGEARLSQVAYGFLRRVPYSTIEPTGSRSFDKKRVCAMLAKYGHIPSAEAAERLDIWIKGDEQPELWKPAIVVQPEKKGLLTKLSGG